MRTVSENTDDIVNNQVTYENQDQISDDGILEKVKKQFNSQSIDQKLEELVRADKNPPYVLQEQVDVKETPLNLKSEPKIENKNENHRVLDYKI